MSYRVPEDLPGRMPENMPEDMPDRMPDRMPKDMSEYMPEDMPDRMPDRMPEDMSDKMPEDLPVRKCINVMVGITRSKVIVFSSVGQIQSHRFHQSFSITHFSTHPCKLFSVDSSWPAFSVPSTGYDLSCVCT